jgi:hypothetical protein
MLKPVVDWIANMSVAASTGKKNRSGRRSTGLKMDFTGLTVTYVSSIPGSTGTQPACLCRNGDNRYVVKGYRADQLADRSRWLTNTLVAHELARLVGVWVPPFGIAVLNQTEFFASEFVDGYGPLDYDKDARALLGYSNAKTIPYLFALDVLLKIPDRKPSDVFVTGEVSRPFLAIDFGNALEDDIKANAGKKDPPRQASDPIEYVSTWLFRNNTFPDEDSRRCAARHVLSFRDRFTQLIKRTGNAAGLDDAGREETSDYLVRRASCLERLCIEAPNWEGGRPS